MEKLNWMLIMGTGLIPLVIGSLYYGPMLFGNVWMRKNGFTADYMQGGNMLKIFSLTALFGVMLAVMLPTIVIHQMGVFASLERLTSMNDTAAAEVLSDFMIAYGQEFRSFKHGALHGMMTSLFVALPIIGINGLFERKSWTYIFIHVGYWAITITLMGGIICAWA